MALKVLLADDSMTAQNMGKKILADAGYDVATVSNGAAAIKKVAEFKPNIVILDIYMPGYTGLEVCERIRAAESSIPVLLTVGKLEPFRQEDVDRVHADAVIVKPFEATDLINTVQKYVNQADVVPAPAAVASPAPVVEMPAVPPPAPVVELSAPAMPAAQLSEEDLAFLRGEVTESVTPAPPAAYNTARAAAAPDFADLLAAPQTPAGHAEPNFALSDFELPPLTQDDFDMLQDASAPAPPAQADVHAIATPAIDLLASVAPEAPTFATEAAVAAPAPTRAETPAFHLEEHLDTPAVAAVESHYGAESILEPAEEAFVSESVEPVAERATLVEPAVAGDSPAFGPATELHTEPAPALAPESVFAAESAYATEPVFVPEPASAPEPAFAPTPTPAAFAHEPVFAPESPFVAEQPEAAAAFDLELPVETSAPAPAEQVMEPILETTPAAAITDVAPLPELESTELEALELEQSGPQPTSEVIATEAGLAPAYEFIGAHGTTPLDPELDDRVVEPVATLAPQHAEATLHEAVLDVAASSVPVAAAAAAMSHFDPALELNSELQPAAATGATCEASVTKDMNYATIAGVVHRVFDRYKSQMIADIVRELSQRPK